MGRTFNLEPTDDPLLIGRSVDPSGMRLVDARVSRRHARIVWDDHGRAFRFGDADSANGCSLNGFASTGTMLGHGDVLRMGDTLFVFEQDSPMATLDETLARVAASSLTLLIIGESGTGKEILARRVHELSKRKGHFVPVNCAALPRDLVAAELFGHTRGAFSNASQARTGLFLHAQDGTLLLDEIGDLPLEQQPALLRVLQEKTVRPVGSDREVSTTARVLAATHVELDQRVENGTFRGDLLARLAQGVIRVPPLRERRAEILGLARVFSCNAGAELHLTPDAAEKLLLWRWPFNIRELQALIETFRIVAPSDRPLDLGYLKQRNPAMVDLPSNLDEHKLHGESKLVDTGQLCVQPPEGLQSTCQIEDYSSKMAMDVGLRSLSPRDKRLRGQLLAHLRQHNGNVSEVSRAMGKARMQIQRWLKRYGIDPDLFRV